MTEEQLTNIGYKICEILCLERSERHKDRFITAWGTETPLGIAKTVMRLIDEGGKQ